MTERDISSKYESKGFKGKYAEPRDEVLHLMTLDGWANESSGDVQSPTGFFSRVVITWAELVEVVDAFEEAITTLGAEPTDLVGNWLVIEDEMGFVHVSDYDDYGRLMYDYGRLEEVYSDWVGDEV